MKWMTNMNAEIKRFFDSINFETEEFFASE